MKTMNVPRLRRPGLTMILQYVTALGFVCFLAVMIAHLVHGVAWRFDRFDRVSRPAPAAGTDSPSPALTTASPAAASRYAAPAGAGTATALDPATRDLQARHLSMPVATVRADQLVESFRDARTGHAHEALDILSPRGTPVIAVEDGTIAKLFWSKDGGHTIYLFDPSRKFAYYYAHLDRYADGLAEGQTVSRGQTIGFVGSTGNADLGAPHLHFGIFALTPEQQWWKGTAIDPYPVLRWATDAPAR